MVCRRTLDVLLTETGFLLKESGWSIDGIWTVYNRKLDGLLTETGHSLDGNETVCWWKESSLFMETVQQIFFILGARKCDFFLVLKPTVSGKPSIFHLIFCILEARECEFCRVVKHRVQEDQASCEQNQRVKVPRRVWKFSSLFRPENAILRKREMYVSRVRSFVWANFPHVPNFLSGNMPHFVSLKMRMVSIDETYFSRYFAKSGNFLHFWGLKMWFCQMVKSTFQGYQAS